MQATDTTLDLWEHLFEDLEGYLVTFTGKQSGWGNELDDIRQRSWRWPAERGKAAPGRPRNREHAFSRWCSEHGSNHFRHRNQRQDHGHAFDRSHVYHRA